MPPADVVAGGGGGGTATMAAATKPATPRSATLMNCFWDLAAVGEAARVTAAATLVR